MKKNLIATVLAAVIILSCLTLSACSRLPDPPQYYITRIVLNVGAEVELMVNTENTVSVVTPLDVEGKILLIDKDFTGYKPEKTVEKIFSLAVKAGLFSSGDTAEFSVSGESDYAKALSKLIEEKLNKLIEKNKLEGQVKTVPEATTEELRDFVINSRFYPEEMVDNHIGGDFNLAIALVRLDTADMPDDAFVSFYFPIFNASSTIRQKEGMRDVIVNMGASQAELAADYAAAITALSEARDKAESDLYALLVAEDSDYRIAHKKLSALIGEGKKQGDAEYDSALSALKTAEENAKASIDEIMKPVDDVSAVLYDMEGTFSTEVVVAYRDVAISLQEKLGEYEKSFLKDFVAKYRSDIDRINSDLKDNQKKLID